MWHRSRWVGGLRSRPRPPRLECEALPCTWADGGWSLELLCSWPWELSLGADSPRDISVSIPRTSWDVDVLAWHWFRIDSPWTGSIRGRFARHVPWWLLDVSPQTWSSRLRAPPVWGVTGPPLSRSLPGTACSNAGSSTWLQDSVRSQDLFPGDGSFWAKFPDSSPDFPFASHVWINWLTFRGPLIFLISSTDPSCCGVDFSWQTLELADIDGCLFTPSSDAKVSWQVPVFADTLEDFGLVLSAAWIMSFKSTRKSPLSVNWSGTGFLNHGLDSLWLWQSMLAWSARIMVLLIKNGVLPGTIATLRWKSPTGTTNAWELVNVPWFPNLKVISHEHRYNFWRVLGCRPWIKSDTCSLPMTVLVAPRSSTPRELCVAKSTAADRLIVSEIPGFSVLELTVVPDRRFWSRLASTDPNSVLSLLGRMHGDSLLVIRARSLSRALRLRFPP